MEKQPPNYLFKVISKENWNKSKESGVLVLDAFDEAFIHLAKEDQIEHVLNKFWKDRKDYLVLQIAVSEMKGTLVYEANRGGTNKYYHLYDGTIPISAIAGFKII